MPARVGHHVHENKDGSITFSYKPTEKGTHEMNLSYNDKQAEGTFISSYSVQKTTKILFCANCH